MHRQTSILSYLKKPPPETHTSTTNIKPHISSSAVSSALGTDTPPEKPPRQVISTNDLTPLDDTKHKPSIFSSILHKFARTTDVNNQTPSSQRNDRGRNEHDPSIVRSMFDIFNDCKKTPTENNNNNNISYKVPEIRASQETNRSIRQSFSGSVKRDFNYCGPETPGERPLVPRLKRVQEECTKNEEKSDFNATSSRKRVRFSEDTKPGKGTPSLESNETASKFEWLHPSRIRDANGRRPGDPLYDKKTLYIPPDVLRSMSATQKQYWSAKCQYMDVMLFFKVGKFYELYELDAEIGHKELDWKITNSGVGKCRQVGISENGIDEAVQKLVARGYKVGRMEQLETSDQAKARGATAVIPRKLVQVFTPSTAFEDNIGPDAVHLLAIKEGSCGKDNGSTIFGFAFVDCAALKIWVGSVSDDASCASLMALLMQVSPKEIIYESRGLSREAQKVLQKYASTGSTEVQINPAQPVNGFLDGAEVKSVIQSKKYFRGSNDLCDSLLDGVIHHDITLSALGGLMDHLSRLMMEDVLCNGDILSYQVFRGRLQMDGQTLINLEIFHNNADGGPAGTLFEYLDKCVTAAGKRLLRSWICHPLKDVEEINSRLNVVEALVNHAESMLVMAQYLRKVPDLERLLGRVKATVHSQAILLLPLVGKKTLKRRVKLFGSVVKGLRLGMDLLILLQNEDSISLLLSKVMDFPKLSGRDGLNEFLKQMEAAIDSDFPMYQDHEVSESDSETLSILTELFVEKASQWSQVIFSLSCIDVLRSFAAIVIDSRGSMSRPLILPQSTSSAACGNKKGPVLDVKSLWHPFALGEAGIPVPNDIILGEHTDGHHPCTLLLTGPNMGGKSTLLRAACLAVIMAQLGCYVPCETCTLSVADIIFTRLGATDRIMTGESTFYIECAETASVLRNATQDSLVLLDELGRGTSTFDGYAIAYAVFRHLIEKVNSRLLFATHYHPLTKEFASHPHVSLQHMACAVNPRSPQGKDNELVFLYRLTSGACPASYGLQVALMAGIPKQVVEAAETAGHAMKQMIGGSFKTSEQRSEFSTLHEGWLNTLLDISSGEGKTCDEDTFDTLFCLWHELRGSYVK